MSSSLAIPACPNPACLQPHVVRNGSHQGRPRFHCRTCGRYFGATAGTPMYHLQTAAAEVAQALLVVMRRGSFRAAEEITGHKYETISAWMRRAADHAEALTAVLSTDLHLTAVEIDEFWSFVQKKRVRPATVGNGGAVWSKTGRVALSSPVPPGASETA